MMTAPNRQRLYRTLTGLPAVIALLIAYAVMAFTSIRDKCTTYDEIAYLTAGYAYWVHNDYRLMPESGNLPQRWVTIPLLHGGYRFPPLEDPDWQNSRAYELGYKFLYEQGNDADAMLTRARSMMIVFGVVLGGIIYSWSRSIFGAAGGTLSLVLYAFSPTMLAHGRFAMADMAVTMMFTASLGCFWITLHRVSIWRLLLSGLVMGTLVIAKMSALLIGPLALVLVLIRLIVNRPLIVEWSGGRRIVKRRLSQTALIVGSLSIHLACIVLVIWASCGFKYEIFGQVRTAQDQMEYGNTLDELTVGRALGGPIRLARDYRLLPEAFLYGFSFLTKVLGSSQHPSFLNGSYSVHGWIRYFPYCFLVKTPLPSLLLMTLAALGGYRRYFAQEAPRHSRGNKDQPVAPAGQGQARRRRRIGRALYRTAPLWVFLLTYWALAILQARNTGHRYILPVYPATFILTGAAVFWFRARSWLPKLAVAGLLLLLVPESLRAWPHYLAYFNQLAGGPSQGYHHLVDSSLDFGQDLPGLKKWLVRQGLTEADKHRVFVAYSGMGSPKYYKIPATVLLSLIEGSTEVGDRPPELTGGVYCISSYILQSVPLPAIGPWAIPYEVEYQRTLTELQRLHQAGEEAPPQMVLLYRRLRLARLCAYLRQREPVDQVGHTILIYRLSDADIQQALGRDPAELEAEVRVEGL